MLAESWCRTAESDMRPYVSDIIASLQFSDLVTVALLVTLEGLLSADNAMVLAVSRSPAFPKPSSGRRCRYGILGAFAFRTLATLLAVYLIRLSWVKVVGAGYLLFLVYRHFGSGQEQRRSQKGAQSAAVDGVDGVLGDRSSRSN